MDKTKLHIVFELPAQKYILSPLGAFLDQFFKSHPDLKKRGEEFFNAIKLALYESVSNVIKHAYTEKKEGQVKIKIELGEKGLILDIIDFGKGFNILEIPEPDAHAPKEGGMGVFLIKTIADSVSYFYSHEEKGNVLHIEINMD